MEENFCIAAFRSRLQVMAFEEAMKNHGMKASIVTTPRAVALGCGLSVRFEEKDAARVRALHTAGELPASRAGRTSSLVPIWTR